MNQSCWARELLLDQLQHHHNLHFTSDSLPVKKSADGKPYLDIKEAPAISLSHSGPWAASAIDSGIRPRLPQLGIDIETLKSRDWNAFAELVFHPAETAWVMAANNKERDIRALRSWCRKEALLKAWGTGIISPLTDIVFDPNGKLVQLPSTLGNLQDWCLHEDIVTTSAQQAVFCVAWNTRNDTV